MELVRRADATYIGSAPARHRIGRVILSMLDDIYSQRILELAGNIPRLGRLDAPQASARAHSKLCGSTVVIDVVMRDGRVSDFAQDVRACALGQASAAIMGRHVIGRTAEELRVARDQLRAMLKDGGPPPNGVWSDLAVLEPIRDYKARHASTMLAFEAAAEAASEAVERQQTA